MATTTTKHGRRFDEEFRREVAALASRPGATVEQVARDLGVSAWSVSRWRRRYRSTDADTTAAITPTAKAALPASAAELERENRALRRELQEVRQQREILKKALVIFSEAPR